MLFWRNGEMGSKQQRAWEDAKAALTAVSALNHTCLSYKI